MMVCSVHKITKWVISIACMMLLVGCTLNEPATPPPTKDEAATATAWFDLALRLVKETPGYTPPVASRAFGYLGVTLYEAVQPGLPGYQSLAGQLNGLDVLPVPAANATYHWPSAANAALARIARQLFPTATPENLAAIDALEAQFANTFQAEVEAETFEQSVQWGRQIAGAVYVWSLSDGGDEGYLHNFPEDYVPPAGPGLWVSTPPAYAKAMQPYWGHNRPFVLASADACPALPPPAYSEQPTSAFYIQALEVYATGKKLTEEQRQIALFWADDPGATATPPGHWIAILNQVLTEQEASLAMAAEAYAKVGLAVADAFISCWYTKYQHNLIRPISYIQQIIDPSWNNPEITDVVLTPPFPEYPSGHSAQSGAAAAVLTALFGENYRFTDHTHDGRGYAPRTFASFNQAVQEAAISRLYGGIHYRAAIENGVTQGQCIGDKVNALKFQK